MKFEKNMSRRRIKRFGWSTGPGRTSNKAFSAALSAALLMALFITVAGCDTDEDKKADLIDEGIIEPVRPAPEPRIIKDIDIGRLSEEPNYVSDTDQCEKVDRGLKQAVLDRLYQKYQIYIRRENDRRRSEVDGYATKAVSSVADPMIADSALESADSASKAEDFSGGTNTQVRGVDESDMFKRNHHRMYQVTSTDIRIFSKNTKLIYTYKLKDDENVSSQAKEEDEKIPSVLPANAVEVHLDYAVPSFEREHFSVIGSYLLSGDKLLLMTSEWSESSHYGAGSQRVKIVQIDFSNLDQVKSIMIKKVPGQYLDSRRTKEGLFVVTSQQMGLTVPDVTFSSYDLSKGLSEEEIKTRYEKEIETVQNWSVEEQRKSSVRKQGISCSDILVPKHSRAAVKNRSHGNFGYYAYDGYSGSRKNYIRSNFTRITYVDPASNQSEVKAVKGRFPTVYMNEHAIYLAGNDWVGSGRYLDLHKFTLKGSLDPSRPKAKLDYVGGFVTPGHLVNQFAMDEYREVLRMAVEVPGGGAKILTLEEDCKCEGLKKLGETEVVARGEDVKSVRFVKERGYVVTFLQVDPLFTVDLSDAENPEILGELKIPGFSTYIHPLADGKLLTIGQGENWGVKLSLFDVSDMTNPTELSVLKFNGRENSDAMYNHKAFSYSHELGLLALPMQGWNYGYHGYEGSESIKIVSTKGDALSVVSEMELEKCRYDHNQVRGFFWGDRVYGLGTNEFRSRDVNTLEEGSDIRNVFKTCEERIEDWPTGRCGNI